MGPSLTLCSRNLFAIEALIAVERWTPVYTDELHRSMAVWTHARTPSLHTTSSHHYWWLHAHPRTAHSPSKMNIVEYCDSDKGLQGNTKVQYSPTARAGSTCFVV